MFTTWGEFGSHWASAARLRSLLLNEVVFSIILPPSLPRTQLNGLFNGLRSWLVVLKRLFKPFFIRLKCKGVGHQTGSATSILASSALSGSFVASTTIHIRSRCHQVNRAPMRVSPILTIPSGVKFKIIPALFSPLCKWKIVYLKVQVGCHN